MRKLMAIAIGVGVLLVLSAMSAGAGTTGAQKRAWTLGPPGCVKVQFSRSRQTRYAGAPRCRRVYA